MLVSAVNTVPVMVPAMVMDMATDMVKDMVKDMDTVAMDLDGDESTHGDACDEAGKEAVLVWCN